MIEKEFTEIIPLDKTQYEEWLKLYEGYAEYYQVQLTNEGVALTWEWLHDASHPVTGLVAVKGKKLVGLAHFRGMPNPLLGCDIGFLDDLYVSSTNRGKGVAAKLIYAVKGECVKQGWHVLRWTTKENNYRARNIYDKLANRFDRIMYQMECK